MGTRDEEGEEGEGEEEEEEGEGEVVAAGGGSHDPHRRGRKPRQSRAKDAKVRPRFSAAQAQQLEAAFHEDRNLSTQRKQRIADHLGVQVERAGLRRPGQRKFLSSRAAPHRRCSREHACTQI